MLSEISYPLSYLKRQAINKVIDMKLERMMPHPVAACGLANLIFSRIHITPDRMLKRVIDMEIEIARTYPKIGVQPYFTTVVQPLDDYSCWVLIKSKPDKRLQIYAFRDITNVDLSEVDYLVSTNQYIKKG
jgi:hypothetical protein